MSTTRRATLSGLATIVRVGCCRSGSTSRILPSRSTASSPGRPSTIGSGEGEAPGLANGLATGDAGRPDTTSGGSAGGLGGRDGAGTI